VTVAASIMAAVAIAGCNSKPHAPSSAAVPEVSVMAVHRTSVPVTIELPGRTSPYLIAQVRARVDGIVQKRAFQEGADVKADQPLYQIASAPYRAALDASEAALQKAQANLAATTAQMDRYKALVGVNAISRQAYDNAVAAKLQAAADVAGAKAAVESAKINLGYTTVVSPNSGRTRVSQVTQGAYVQASTATLMTSVQQLDPIYVDLSQSSVDSLRLREEVTGGEPKVSVPNQVKVALTLEDGTQYPLTGTLEFSGTTVDPATGSVNVRAVFPNPKYVLLPGMFVHARLALDAKSDVVLVPVPAVTHDPQGRAIVSVLGPDNKIAQRVIQAGSMVGDSWAVKTGLNDGERIVVSGAQNVTPGSPVKAVDVPNPKAVAGAPDATRLARTDESDAAATATLASEAK
jgi:membrane fusion protein (multidrug efflux system)